MESIYYTTAFYSFHHVENLEESKAWLVELAQKLSVEGLLILAHEGVNGTISTTLPESITAFEAALVQHWPHSKFEFNKHANSTVRPFVRFVVKIRPEIVTIHRPDMVPQDKKHHLSPSDWDKVIATENVVLLDTRNDYETKLGTFKNAIKPPIEEFGEFSSYVKNSQLPKEQKILIFCTGGIRCEKAILEMHDQGYNNVWQLDGGILNYFAKTKGENWDGECFVFDHRVSLNKDLSPSGKTFCPHCGQAADILIECVHCDTPMKICDVCAQEEIISQTCSKNCAYQHGRVLKKQLLQKTQQPRSTNS